MKILMGTENPGKIEGARQAFAKYCTNFEIEGIAVDSEVGNQPFDEEILLGAKNRIKNLRKYAEERKIPFFSKSIDIKKFSISLKIGTEEAGREARYSFFDEVLKNVKRN